MRILLTALLATTALVTASAPIVPAISAQPRPTPPKPLHAAERALHRQHRAVSPGYGTTLGDHRFDDKLPDITACGRGPDRVRPGDARRPRQDRSQGAEPRQSGRRRCSRTRSITICGDRDAAELVVERADYNDVAGGRALHARRARFRAVAAAAQGGDRADGGAARLPARRARRHWSRRRCRRSTRRRSRSRTAASSKSPKACSRRTPASCRVPTARGSMPRSPKLKAAVADQQIWLDEVLVPAAQGRFPPRRQALRPEDEVRARLRHHAPRTEGEGDRRRRRDARRDVRASRGKVLPGALPAIPDRPPSSSKRRSRPRST